MWQDEVQRIGKKRCTPTGYRLHGVSDLIGFVALILLLGVTCHLIYSTCVGTATWLSLWMLFISFGLAITGNMLHSYSWHLANTRQFKYDYEKRIATWCNRDGGVETYTYEDWRRENDTDESSPPAA